MAARNVPVTYDVPDGMVAEYATHMVVQNGDRETFLLFFQVQPPIISGEAEERQKQLEALTSVSARCVAKIILAPAKIPEMIKALQEINVARQRDFSEEP